MIYEIIINSVLEGFMKNSHGIIVGYGSNEEINENLSQE
jgi:hypothetical protein